MTDKEYSQYERPEIKIMSPLERLSRRTQAIAKIVELDEVQEAHLRRYANLIYRSREIKREFYGTTLRGKIYDLGSTDNQTKIISITRDNYREWLVSLDSMQKSFIRTYSDKDKKLTIARIEVEQAVDDIIPQDV